MIRVFINGFGRIGRHVARIVTEDSRFRLAGINDPGSFDQMAMLLAHDSLYGRWKHRVFLSGRHLCIDDVDVPLFGCSDPADLDPGALDVDVVLACCGVFLSKAACQSFLDAGAKKVIISTPPKDDMPVFIRGVNDHRYGGETILSNSSCSANAIVPLTTLLDQRWGVQSAMFSMYHSYTAYQRLVDSAHYSRDIRRSRSATQNIIPLQSSAAEATARFFPHLEGKLYAKSVRVPLAATTFYDLSFVTKNRLCLPELHRLLDGAVGGDFAGILAMNDTPKVSSDFIGDPHSGVIERAWLDVVEGNMVRIGAWQDNEYGYARRLVELAAVVGMHGL